MFYDISRYLTDKYFYIVWGCRPPRAAPQMNPPKIFFFMVQARVPVCFDQRWSRGHKARGQGQGHKKNPRPRPAFPRTDTLEAKDRNAQGQGQGPRTQAQVLSKKKKKDLHKNFTGDLHKKRFPKNFSSAPQNFNNSKNSAVLKPRTGQFSRTWGLEAKDLTFKAKAKDFKMCPRGLHLWFWYQQIFNRQIFWHSLGVPPPWGPPQMDPQKSIFWTAQFRVPVFYDIRRYLTDNYFDSTFLEVPLSDIFE